MKKIAILIMLALVIAFASLCDKLNKENTRLLDDQAALLEKCVTYKTEADKNAASCRQLTITNKELKEYYSEIVKKAKELGLQVKRLQTVSEAGTHTAIKIQTVIKDSIVYRDSIMAYDMIKVLSWHDPWVCVSGMIRGDTANLDVTTRDTITQFVHRIPHKFLFFKWGTKSIRQEMRCSNPHAKLTYTTLLRLSCD